MIGSDVLQRLIGGTIFLAGERTLRPTDGQKSAIDVNATAKGQPADVSNTVVLASRSQRHFTQASSWPSAPILPAETLVQAAILQSRNEIATAPIVYLETVADAPAAMRMPDPPAPQPGATMQHILYPTAELAHALSRTSVAPSATASAAKLATQQAHSMRENPRSADKQELRGFAGIAAIAAGVVVLAACAAVFLI